MEARREQGLTANRHAPVRAATCVVQTKARDARDARWSARGTGVVVAPDAVLTCRHVVEGAAPEALNLVFPWDADGGTFRSPTTARVARSELAADGADLALLWLAPEGAGAASPGVAGRTLPLGAAALEETFLAWGYRDVGAGRGEAGLPAFGVVRTDAADRGQRVLYLKSEEVDLGMSGGPVVQGERPRLVGVLTTALPREHGSFALPVDRLAEQFPSLGALALLPPESPAPAPERLRWLARRRPSALFVGREEDLLALDGDLHAAGLPGPQVAVEGLPGVGKTEVALQYVRRFGDPLRYPGGVLWLDAASDLGAQWAALAPELGIDPRGVAPEALEAAVLGRLAARPGLLLVLDNVDSWSEVRDHLPPPDAGHALLVTTRARGLAGPQLRHRPLELLSPEGARSLLAALLGQRAERHPEEVEALAKSLGGHTLALEVAGAYLGRNPHVAAAEFLARSWKPVPERTLDAVAYQKDVSRMMDEVVAGLEEPAAQLFALTGLYGEAPAPVALLRSTWERLRREWFDEAFGDLYGLHLLDHDEGWWTMHRLIRAAARGRLAGDERARVEEAHAHCLADAVVALAEYDFAGFAALEPHVREEIARGERTFGSARVLGQSARFLRRLGKLTEARDWAQRAVDLALSLPGVAETELATLRSNLATILQDLGDLQRARRETEEALRIDLDRLGADHPNVAIRRSNLATILKDLGDLQGARREANEALRIDLGRLGADHPNVAIRRSNLAQILQDLGDLQGAKQETEEALRIDLARLGPDHPNVAIDRSNLALILKDLGDLQGARRETEEALRTDLDRLGADHPNVATDRSNLATILKDLGDLQGARRETEEALRIDLASLGPGHPNVAIDRSNLAIILQNLGNLPGAQRETEEALRIGLPSLGADHPTVAIRRSNLALILKDIGDLQGARREAEEALRIDLASLGADHPKVAIRRSNLADILEALGDLTASRREAAEAVRIVRRMPEGAQTREAILGRWP